MANEDKHKTGGESTSPRQPQTTPPLQHIIVEKKHVELNETGIASEGVYQPIMSGDRTPPPGGDSDDSGGTEE